ncbi:MAG: general stress protein 26 [Hyphomicrobiaceae bacterium]|jgi:general stress protein 26
MPNVRSKIALSESELHDYFASSKTIIMATHNHDGYPHMVPMWFTMIAGLVHMHTYRSSQKTRNIERDPRGAVLIEDGEDYGKLRGVYVRGHFEIRDDQELCLRIGLNSAMKYQGLDAVQVEAAADGIRSYVAKRVALIFHPEKSSSWDHRKI